jgi:hypothetical protein
MAKKEFIDPRWGWLEPRPRRPPLDPDPEPLVMVEVEMVVEVELVVEMVGKRSEEARSTSSRGRG